MRTHALLVRFVLPAVCAVAVACAKREAPVAAGSAESTPAAPAQQAAQQAATEAAKAQEAPTATATPPSPGRPAPSAAPSVAQPAAEEADHRGADLGAAAKAGQTPRPAEPAAEEAAAPGAEKRAGGATGDRSRDLAKGQVPDSPAVPPLARPGSTSRQAAGAPYKNQMPKDKAATVGEVPKREQLEGESQAKPDTDRPKASTEALDDARELARPERAPQPRPEPLEMRKVGSSGGKTAGRGFLPYHKRVPPPQPFASRHPDKTFRPLPPRPSVFPRDARYRSTYLPGRGYLDHLAGFLQQESGPIRDVALARNLAPYRDLAKRVTTLDRARPGLPAPHDRALEAAIDQLHGQLPPEGGRTTLRLRLRATEANPQGRRPLKLHLVLDGSGSMKGEPWQAVCTGTRAVAQRLQPGDVLSVTVYSTTAAVLSPPVPAGPAALQVAEQVCRRKPRGETNIADGLRLGYEQALGAYDVQATNRVVLLSDGMPTVGPRDPYLLTLATAEALGRGVTTSAVGVGSDFDALLMGRVALEGGGSVHFARQATAISAVLADELDVLAEEVAAVVDVRLRLADDLRLVEVIGSEPLNQAEALRAREVEVQTDQRLAQDQGIAADRQRDVEGGVRLLLPTFRRGDEHAVLLVVEVPPGEGVRDLAAIELRYKDLLAGRNVTLRGNRQAAYADSPATAKASAREDLVAAEARARAGQALQRASEYLDLANTPRIRGELLQASAHLRAAADATGQAPLHAEATSMRALADAVAQAMTPQQMTWLSTAFHYRWRMCGATAWGG